jgi:hypothetical protein
MDKNSVVSRQAGSAAAAVLVVDGKLSISGRISVCDFFSFVVVVTCDALLSHQLRPYSLSRSLLPATWPDDIQQRRYCSCSRSFLLARWYYYCAGCVIDRSLYCQRPVPQRPLSWIFETRRGWVSCIYTL